METKTCAQCTFWTPKYYGVGECRRQGEANAKLWTAEHKELFTVKSFSCSEFVQASPEKETL